MRSLPIHNDSTDQLELYKNNSSLAVLGTGASYSLTLVSSDSVKISNSAGYVILDCYSLANTFDNITVIDDANSGYTDSTTSQPLGANVSVPYGSNSSTLFMSIPPPYFLMLTGGSPGMFTQVNANAYIIDSSGGTVTPPAPPSGSDIPPVVTPPPPPPSSNNNNSSSTGGSGDGGSSDSTANKNNFKIFIYLLLLIVLAVVVVLMIKYFYKHTRKNKID